MLGSDDLRESTMRAWNRRSNSLRRCTYLIKVPAQLISRSSPNDGRLKDMKGWGDFFARFKSPRAWSTTVLDEARYYCCAFALEIPEAYGYGLSAFCSSRGSGCSLCDVSTMRHVLKLLGPSTTCWFFFGVCVLNLCRLCWYTTRGGVWSACRLLVDEPTSFFCFELQSCTSA